MKGPTPATKKRTTHKRTKGFLRFQSDMFARMAVSTGFACTGSSFVHCRALISGFLAIKNHFWFHPLLDL